MVALFAKGTVNGAELIGELRAMREAMQAQKTALATRDLMGTLNSANAANLQSGFFQDRLVDLAITALEETLKQQAVNVSFRALDEHLRSVLDNPNALRAETVQLPSPQGMNDVQMRRALVMGTLVVTARVTNKMLKAAEQDFRGIEDGYAGLIGRREAAATVLYEVLSRGEGSRSAVAGLSAADADFGRKSVASMSINEFSRDLGAQNLALSYLQRTDAKAFASYKAESDKLLPAAQGYLRTVSGGVAFAGMLTLFAQESASMARGKNAAEIVAMLPLVRDFAVEVPALIPVAAKAVSGGVSMPFESSKMFRVGAVGGTFQEFGGARQVFSELEKSDAENMLQRGMFRRDTSGLLHRMYMCSPAEAGRLLDTALKTQTREMFAQDYLNDERPRFSFETLFEQPQQALNARERVLGDELLRSDYRERADARRMPFSALQKQVSEEGGYKSWTDEQLMRLIFVNREGQARHAELQLGNVAVRPVANARSVFAYEALVDACRRVVDPEAGTRPAARPPARAPAPAPTPPRVRTPAAAPT